MIKKRCHSPVPQTCHVECRTGKSFSRETKKSAPKINNCKAKSRKRVALTSTNTTISKETATISKETALEALKTMLPQRIVNFIEDQIELHSGKKRGQRYFSETKYFDLSLYNISGKAYGLISKFSTCFLKKSLLKWVSGLPKSPGFTQTAMDVIATKVKLMNESMHNFYG